MGLLPILIVFVLGLWQLGLIGYTYVIAGHAAQEGARMLAVNPTDGKPGDAAYKKIRTRAMGEVPTAWRTGAEVDVPEERSTVAVSLKVPVVLPGVRSPFSIGSRAATAIEDEELPPTQAQDPGAGDVSWRSERGQASVEFMGMVFWLLVATVVVWQLMLAAWTANQATNAARTASRVSARPDGDPEKAARNAVSGPLRAGFHDFRASGDRATVHLRIPILLPGLTADGFSVTRRATLPS